MRLNLPALGLLLPVAALLSGCALGTSGSAITGTNPAKAIRGKAFGGQSPVANATIAVYSYGTTGYGSSGQLLAQTTTGSDGYFNLDPSSITCPTPQTPVYILSVGGDPGFGPNAAIVEGSGLGACSDAANAFVTINEISTAALAYTFSHFFSTANAGGDNITADHFGAPAGQAATVTRINYNTQETLLDVENGYPRQNTSTFRFEGAKIISLGNILGNCVNSNGAGSPTCTALFSNIKSPSGAAPTNILEAAVYLALTPNQNTGNIFALQPPSGATAFDGGLTAAPADWTLSASYTSPSFALSVNTRTVSTIDIDTSGRVWFPSNGPGVAGVGYFDPNTASFSPLFAAPLQHPQQVAIDIDNYVWASDNGSSNVAGFPPTNPTTPVVLSLPGTSSTSVTIANDNTVRYGIIAPSGQPGLARVDNKNAYAEIPNSEVPGGNGFIASSIAGDYIGGAGVSGQLIYSPTTYDLYYAPNGNVSFVTYQSFQDAGQVAFTGTDFVSARGGYGPGADGICIYSMQNCFSMAFDAVRHPSALTIDGTGNLWLADKNVSTVERVYNTNGSYLNSNGQANNITYLHDDANGGTMPHPAGIAVDTAGNVWVSNAGCSTDGCNPGTSFTLTELVGLASPTITPVSRQVVINDLVGTQPQVISGKTAK